MRCLLVVIGVLAVGCITTSQVTPLGPARPALQISCPVNIVRDGQPPYPHVDIAKVRASCLLYDKGDQCLVRLRVEVCAAGGDTVYGFSESADGDFRTVAAVIAYRPDKPAAPTLLHTPPSPAAATAAAIAP
jgi:hypothetical protein